MAHQGDGSSQMLRFQSPLDTDALNPQSKTVM